MRLNEICGEWYGSYRECFVIEKNYILDEYHITSNQWDNGVYGTIILQAVYLTPCRYLFQEKKIMFFI